MVTKLIFFGKSLNATLQKALQKNSRLWMWQYQMSKKIIKKYGTFVPRTGRNMKIRRVYLD